ncbi:MAG: calcium-binding protein [Methanobrevibacter sp.]|nr:calcium-binding protein [Candidatus Methanoflexus mossambicus]
MEKDLNREKRIDDGPICDAYGDEEISWAWEAYMDDRLIFPFKAKIINNSSTDIPIGEIVTVIDSLDEFDIAGTVSYLKDNSYSINTLIVNWNDKKEFFVSFEDLKEINANDEAIEAIKDWNYWLEHY